MSEEKKKLIVKEDLCVGCGLCETVAGDYFDVSDGISKVIKGYDENDEAVLNDAIASCPAGAIVLE